MIEDILVQTQTAEGAAAAEARYRELREICYPGFAYDFSPRRLGDFANKLFDEGDVDGGMRFHTLAEELYPGDGFTYLELGRGLEGLGRLEEALVAYEKALALEPGFGNFLVPTIDDVRDRIVE